MTRRYESSVREERAHQTRLALLDACEALLAEGPVEDVTLPAVARRAGVTKPTAYSHFPDNDALMAGLLAHLREKIGMAHAAIARIPPAKLAAAVKENYRRFEKSSVVLRRVMDSPSYNRVRLARDVDRAGVTLPMWSDVDLDVDALRERLGPVYLLLTPASWRWLRDTWGLDSDAAARAGAWAMQALVEDLLTNTNTKGPHENSSRHDPGPRSRARRARPR